MRPEDSIEALLWEQAYARRSETTVEFLHLRGRFVERCHCGSNLCHGWAMGHPWEEAILEDFMRS